jgi:hypothetical protein
LAVVLRPAVLAAAFLAVFRVPARIAIAWARGVSVVVSSVLTRGNSLLTHLLGVV